jgi:hypothetical protein
MRRPATRGRSKSRVGLGLAARSSGERGPHAGTTVRAPGVLAAWSPRPFCTHDGVVDRTPAARLCLVGDKVLPVRSGEAPGRHRAGSQGWSSPKRGRRRGGGSVAGSDGVRGWRGGSGGHRRCSRGPYSTGKLREVRRGSRLTTGSLGGWSSLRGDKAAVVAWDSSPTGVLRWLGWDERHMGVQEGSRADDSTWREREGAEKELTAWRCELPFQLAEKEMGRGVPVGVSAWRME